MMRGIVVAASIAAGAIGCAAEPDPGRGPLSAGVMALTHYDTTYGVPGRDDPSRVTVHLPPGLGIVGAGFAEIPVGIRVRVIADPGGDDPSRMVRVTIGDGEYQGIAASIARERLRPAP